MSYAICFNLDQCKILSSGNGLILCDIIDNAYKVTESNCRSHEKPMYAFLEINSTNVFFNPFPNDKF